VDGRAVHEVEHPVRRPSGWSRLSAGDGSGQAGERQRATLGCRFLDCKSAEFQTVVYNRRADFAHKRSRELVSTYQVIVFEDLAPREMGRSRGMRKSILDVAWSQFISMTVAKAEEAGRRVVLVNPRNTSKMCSSCGELVQKTLSERTHTCPHCGLVMGRDHNAALNILHRGLQTLRL
jgi:IS605 OrfB family transposase